MITVLVVAPKCEDLTRLFGRHPSVEIVWAHDAQETLEKLGRNRRIDAILLLTGGATAEILEAIREENPAPPPLFVPEAPANPPGARCLPAQDPAELLDRLVAEIVGAG